MKNAGTLQERTVQAALEALRAAAARRGSVRWKDIPHRTYAVLLREFGTFKRALRAARAPSWTRPRRWSRERVLDEVREAHRDGVRITSRGLAQAGRLDLLRAITTYVKGIPRARRLAGVPDPPPMPYDRSSWSMAGIRSEIRAQHKAGESLAATKVPPTLLNAGWRLFGSWREAIEEAGLVYEDVCLHRRYSDEEVLAKLRQLLERRATWSVMDLPRTFASCLRSHFGTVEEAAARATLPAPTLRVQLLSRAEVLRALRQRQRAGKAVHVVTVRDDDPRLYHSARRHFEDWELALRAAKIVARPLQRRWDRARVLAALRRRRRAGMAIWSTDVKKDDPGLHMAACKYWGAYRHALRALGVAAQRPRRGQASTVGRTKHVDKGT